MTENQTKAILAGIDTNDYDAEASMDELEELAQTAGAEAIARVIQKRSSPDSATVLGEGKIAEISELCKSMEADLIIFDCELSASQIRNIEKVAEVRTIDRTMLILDIFAGRAVSREGKLQVELAQLKYRLPRLVGMGMIMSRLGGGIGTRGPGETQLETDRRIILNKISKLKNDLKEIDRQKFTQRQNRGKMVRVALVGYTNVGKSTLMNLLSKSEVFAENKLFATLDTTVRKVTIENLAFLLSDTVGFIRKLPTQLIESFKSTLNEVREADLLVHIVDISHSAFEDHIKVVTQTLNDISKEEKPSLVVFNKIDAFSYIEKESDDLTPKTKENISLEELKQTWMSNLHENSVFISAMEKQNIEELKTILYNKVREIHVQRFPYNDFLYQETEELKDGGTEGLV